MTGSSSTARVQAALEQLRSGGMVILLDDEAREDEGDLVVMAEHATPAAINFMATHGRGLICLALAEEQVDRLELPLMATRAGARRSTAFTVSIEAREGVTTGISAHDRARTIAAAIARGASPRDLVSPGHVFPLRARRDGVLEREGHTEGAVDLALLAGGLPAAVICEIMNDDGTMARRRDLSRFAARHGLPILGIGDVLRHRVQTEDVAARVRTAPFRPAGLSGEWKAHTYRIRRDRQLLLLTLGAPAPAPADHRATLVYTHRAALVSDLLGDADLFDALRDIESAGAGAVIYVPPPAHQPAPGEDADIGLELAVAARELGALGHRRITLLDSRAPWPAGPKREIDLETGEPPASPEPHGAPLPARGRAVPGPARAPRGGLGRAAEPEDRAVG
ncbi:3,4-dihydroxy-2-butanone-4-phosphate synthase [Sorangium sp. So ce1389]|uniref:3,4-dihydroxy-2-butanone-4-phosphate synthase n=1 Tax=Sorangium sp. So ce1389 TaxID=3133336 RepID=UPI003F5F9515